MALPFPLRPLRGFFLHRYWQRTGGMLGFAVLLGIGGGLTAALFRKCLVFVETVVLHRWAGFPFEGPAGAIPHYLFFLVPAAGGLLSGILVYSLAPQAEGAGTDALIDAFHNRGGHVSAKTAVVKFFASLLTLGSGGSAGQEGPMAQIGGGLGSLLARLFRLPERMRRILLLTGTAAGLGAIFHAPLGAALTAAEIVYREDFESQGFMPFTVASVVAFALYSVVMHQHGAYLHFPVLPFTSLSELFIYALVGLACVPVSWAFVTFYRRTRRYFSEAKVPAFTKPAIGGLLVGLIAYACPQAVGSDWGNLTRAVGGDFGFAALFLIAGAKILATAFTIGSGGSGGVFGPSLFIGGMVGGAVGYGMHAIEPGWVANPGSYVLVGMGAFFAGAAKAPLAGLIMVCEITGNYGLLPPLLIASILHLSLARKWSLYDGQRHDKFASPVHEHALKVDVLKHVPLKAAFKRGEPFVAFDPETSLADAYARMAGSAQEVFPVLGGDGAVAGLVTSAALHWAVIGASPDSAAGLEEVMIEAHALETGMDLREALTAFLEAGVNQLPVLDDDGTVAGMLGLHAVLSHYDRITQGIAKRQSALIEAAARSRAA